MHWFLIALINPVVLAFINHFDKFLLSKYIKGGTVGALIVFSALFSIFLLPILFIFQPSVVTSVTLLQGLILTVNGMLLTIAILFYLYALDDEEASHVAPFFELIPLFGLGLGFLLLSELPASQQLIAGGVIILGALVMSIDLSPSTNKFKLRLALLMIGSSFFYALNAVLFKFIAVEVGFVTSLFWDMSGKVLLGFFFLVFIASYRNQFISLVKNNPFKIFTLNSVNEILGIIGEVALVYATLLAPVVLVQTVGSIHSAIVFIIGIFCTIFIPKFATESLEKKILIQKICGIALMIGGVYLLEF